MKYPIVFNGNTLHYQYSMKISFLSLVLCIILLSNCSKKDPTTDEKVLIETDANKKTREFADKGGGLFGDINNKKSGSTTFEFASSNVLWRATLKSLDFLPLINADYSGGVIIYDWYSQTNNPKEQIKISVQFLNNELRADSIKITAHKKICDSTDRCSNSTLDQNFANSIKENIIASARSLKIEESKKEKK
jgi:hypothetical protein